MVRNWSTNSRAKQKSLRELENSFNLKRRIVKFKMYPKDIEALEIRCQKEGASLQEAFESIAKSLIRGNKDVLSMLRKHLARKKENKELSLEDTNNIYEKLRIESVLDDPVIDEGKNK